RIAPTFLARVAIKGAGEKLGPIAEPLSADAELVPLAHTLMAEVGAPFLYRLAQAAKLLLLQLGNRTGPQLFAELVVIGRPGPGLDPFHDVDHDRAEALRAQRLRYPGIGGSALFLDIAQSGGDVLIPRPRFALRSQHIGHEDIKIPGGSEMLGNPFELGLDLPLLLVGDDVVEDGKGRAQTPQADAHLVQRFGKPSACGRRVGDDLREAIIRDGAEGFLAPHVGLDIDLGGLLDIMRAALDELIAPLAFGLDREPQRQGFGKRTGETEQIRRVAALQLKLDLRDWPPALAG